MGPKLRKAFQKAEGQNFSDSDWLSIFAKEATKRGSSIARIQKFLLVYSCPFKGHIGGNLIAPELMGHVAIPYKWKKFLFHRGCSLHVTSILRSGLIGGGREGKEGRQTIFLHTSVMQKVQELVVHERVSQGKGVKGRKEKKKVPGWSIEEMRGKPDVFFERRH